jgi:hypothetical protein
MSIDSCVAIGMFYIKCFSISVATDFYSAYIAIGCRIDGKTFSLLGLDIKAAVKVVAAQFAIISSKNQFDIQWVGKIIG